MNAIAELGLPFIVWLQGLGEWLFAPMSFFSFLGNEEFFLLVMPSIFWSVNSALGVRLGIALLVNGSLNAAFQLFSQAPRPYWIYPEVKAYSAQTTFSFPSGHSQMAAGVWGMLASQINKRWVWLASILIIALIGLSRIYLGVHFPVDVLAGWLAGSLILWIILRYWNAAEAWLAPRSLSSKILLAFLSSIAFILLSVIAHLLLQGWSVPQGWLDLASRAGPDDLPNPASLNVSITSAATLFGFLAGFAWLKSQGGFLVKGTIWQRLLRIIVGLLGLLLLWFGLGQVFPRGEELISYVLRYVRYSLIGFWVSGFAPFLFLKLGLARQDGP